MSLIDMLINAKDYDVRNEPPAYEVSGIVPKKYGKEIAGGDAHTIKTFEMKSNAFALAKKESKLKKWHEVQVRATDGEGELIGHWYFKNGKLTTDMSL